MLKKLVPGNKTALYAAFFIIMPLFFSGCLGLFEEETEDGIAIGTAEDLARIGHDSEYPLNGSYYLEDDIDMTAYGGWTPIGFRDHEPFTGKFDGRGKTIKNLRLGKNGPGETPLAIGLFGYTLRAEIWDMTIEIAENAPSVVLNSDLEQYVGALAGKAEESAFFNIAVGGKGISVNKAGGRTGGVYLGSVAGYLGDWSTVEACDSRTALAADAGNGTVYAGGIAGYAGNSAYIQRSSAAGDISASGSSAHAGGIAGRNDAGIIRDSSAAGAVSAIGLDGDAYAGGIAGSGGGAVRNTCASGDVAAETGSAAAYGGGIAGFLETGGTVEYSVARSALIKVTAPDPITNRWAGRITGNAAGTTGNAAFNGMELEAYENAATPSSANPGDPGESVSMEALRNRRLYAENGMGWDFDTIWDWDPAEKTPRLR
jgi:hypothetical protein